MRWFTRLGPHPLRKNYVEMRRFTPPKAVTRKKSKSHVELSNSPPIIPPTMNIQLTTNHRPTGPSAARLAQPGGLWVGYLYALT